MFLDVILVEPRTMHNLKEISVAITPYHYLIHTLVETAVTIIIEGVIFKVFCKEISFKKVALVNAITCIGLHVVYYILANTYFLNEVLPPNPTFNNLVTTLLTKHILLIAVLEAIVCIVEYLFYIRSSDKKLKVFIVTICANVVAFFVGVVVSVSVVLLLMKK